MCMSLLPNRPRPSFQTQFLLPPERLHKFGRQRIDTGKCFHSRLGQLLSKIICGNACAGSSFRTNHTVQSRIFDQSVRVVSLIAALLFKFTGLRKSTVRFGRAGIWVMLNDNEQQSMASPDPHGERREQKPEPASFPADISQFLLTIGEASSLMHRQRCKFASNRKVQRLCRKGAIPHVDPVPGRRHRARQG